MRNIITLLAASLLATTAITNTAAAYAVTTTETGNVVRYPLLKGLSGPKELASLMKLALKADPKGNSPLAPARCAKKKSDCITPRGYLQNIAAWHPKTGFHDTDDDMLRLPIFIENLQLNRNKTAEYFSSSQVEVNGKFVLDLTLKFTRTLELDETTWADSQTGEDIFFSNCANVVKMKDKVVQQVVVKTSYCNVIHAFTDAGDRLSTFTMTPDGRPVPDLHHCFAHKLVGEANWVLGLPGVCDTQTCRVDDAERVRDLREATTNTVSHLQEGEQLIRVPVGVVITLCRYGDHTEYKAQSFIPASFRDANAWVRRSDADAPGAYAINWKVYRE